MELAGLPPTRRQGPRTWQGSSQVPTFPSGGFTPMFTKLR